MLKILRSILKKAENRASFFARIRRLYVETSAEYQLILKAYNVAKDEFREVYRDDLERYFEHLRFVAIFLVDYLMVVDANLIAAALLHDIVEDRPGWTVARVRAEFNEEVALYVDWVSKPPVSEFSSKEERNRVYHERMRRAPRGAILIKAADRMHNHLKMWVWSKKAIRRKVEETKRWFMPLFEREIVLVHEMREVMQLLLEGKNPMTGRAAA